MAHTRGEKSSPGAALAPPSRLSKLAKEGDTATAWWALSMVMPIAYCSLIWPAVTADTLGGHVVGCRARIHR